MNHKKAKEEGFTHYGSYYGIPVYLSEIESEAPVMAVKWNGFDFLLDMASHIEWIVSSTLYPDAELSFMIKIKGEL